MKHSTYPALAGRTAMSLVALMAIGEAHAQSTNPQTFEPPAVFQAAGPSTASIQASLDAYRLALGGDNNGVAKGPIATGRREINWDGGGSTATSLAGTPFTQFLDGRGSLFVTPGSGFVQAPPSGLAGTFANPTYEKVFQPFSPGRLFSSIGSNVTVVTFFEPGSAGGLVATTRGFGAIFSDVDLPDGSGPGSKRGNRSRARWSSTTGWTASCSTAASCRRHPAMGVSRSWASRSKTRGSPACGSPPATWLREPMTSGRTTSS